MIAAFKNVLTMSVKNGEDQLPREAVIEDGQDGPPIQRSQSPLFLSLSPSPKTSGITNTASFAIIVPPVENRDDYLAYEDHSVVRIIREAGASKYVVRFGDGRQSTVRI